jgi:hypothetical protein
LILVHVRSSCVLPHHLQLVVGGFALHDRSGGGIGNWLQTSEIGREQTVVGDHVGEKMLFVDRINSGESGFHDATRFPLIPPVQGWNSM